MAARRGNKAWLRQQLAKALKWDADTAEGVVEAVAAAGSQEEVDALVEAYMGGDPSAANLVRQFRGPPASGGQPPPAPPAPGMQLYQRDSEMRQLESSLRGGGAGAGAGDSGSSSSAAGGSGRARAPPQAVELPPPAAADKAKPLLDMGRNVAVTVKPSKKKGGSSEAGSSSGSGTAKSLAKPVVNCLSCGKIYDCRSMLDEAVRFLESGGICTFCGKRVMLRYADGSTNMAGDEAAGPSSAAGAAAGSAGDQGAGELAGFKPESQQGNAADAVAYNDSQAAAVALKDRLVEYDRQSAKRTTVLDDQSDFFEIDANAWLTDEERAVLKQRERELAEAEEARRRRVMVTFDLLGRKVIVDGSADGSDEATAAAEAAAVAAQLDAARAAAAAKALAATTAEAAQGGSAAAPTALAAVEERLRDLRITVNPSMAARHFVFLPQQQKQQQSTGGMQQQPQSQAAGGHAGPGQQGGSRGSRSGKGQRPRKAAGSGGGISRLQHDDPFLGFEEVQVLAGDEAGRHALEAAGAAQAVAG